MKKAIFGMVAFLMATSAFATNGGNSNNSNNGDTNVTVNAPVNVDTSVGVIAGGGNAHATGGSSNVWNTNQQSQDQMQGQMQGQGQLQGQQLNVGNHALSPSSSSHSNASQDQSQSALSNANNNNHVQGSQSSSGGNTQNTTYQQVKQHHNVPSMALFTPPPTSPCVVTYGGAGSGAGFGFSITGGIRNENCEKLEVAKALAAINQLDASLEMICNTDHAKNENLSVCTKFRPEPVKVVKVEQKQETQQVVTVVAPKATADEVNGVVTVTDAGTKMLKDSTGKIFWFNSVSSQWIPL